MSNCKYPGYTYLFFDLSTSFISSVFTVFSSDQVVVVTERFFVVSSNLVGLIIELSLVQFVSFKGLGGGIVICFKK